MCGFRHPWHFVQFAAEHQQKGKALRKQALPAQRQPGINISHSPKEYLVGMYETGFQGKCGIQIHSGMQRRMKRGCEPQKK
jgi:hypothetical protein